MIKFRSLFLIALMAQAAFGNVPHNVWRKNTLGVPKWGPIDLSQSAARTGILPKANGGLGADASGLIIPSGGTLATVESIAPVGGLIANGTAEVDASGAVAYANAAGTTPVTGTGGTPVTAVSRITTLPLQGAGSFRITKDAANRQGEGVAIAFSAALALQGRPTRIDFDFRPGGSYAAGDVGVFVYDVTNSTLIPVSPSAPPATAGISHFTGAFTASATGASYRLIFHVTTTNASAWTFDFDNLVVQGRPLQTVQTFTSGSGTYTPSPGTSIIRVRMIGGGGGGAGSGTAGGGASSATDTTFGTRTAGGGGAGARLSTGGGGAPSGTGYTLLAAINGSPGAPGAVNPSTANGTQLAGGAGGASVFGGAGAGGPGGGSGAAAQTNSGSGGGGGGNDNVNASSSGGGGGAGAYVEFYAPAVSYSYAVGAGGSGGSAGTGSSRTGGAGAAGLIGVEEIY